MIQKPELNNKTKYTSCIKINGKPILPPLVTHHKKEELQCYRSKAIEIESRIRQKANETQFHTATLEHQLSFITNSPVTNDVPCLNRDYLNLTCDVVDVSEYSNNGIRLFCDTTHVDYSKEPCSTAISESFDEKKDSFDEEFEKKPPRLIRSNSYTLESPSPVLLAHLRNMSLESSYGDDSQNWKPPEMQKADQQKDSNSINEKTQTQSAFDMENSVQNNTEGETKNDTESENFSLSLVNKTDDAAQMKSSSPSSPTYKTDFTQTEIDMELQNILNKLSSHDKEQILLLLKLQEQGQVTLNPEVPVLVDEPTCIDSCSQTACFPPADSQSVLTQTSQFSEMNIDFGDTSDDNNFVQEKRVSDTVVRNILNCSKKLFSEDDVWLQQRLRQEWAASVIVAHVKGYLTRRLMATERVRTLIETIKDALICAMQLHAETTENINESDVELHRRLVQQISAACYAFHDIFFSLSAPQQMAIIAHDRRRLKERTLKIATPV